MLSSLERKLRGSTNPLNDSTKYQSFLQDFSNGVEEIPTAWRTDSIVNPIKKYIDSNTPQDLIKSQYNDPSKFNSPPQNILIKELQQPSYSKNYLQGIYAPESYPVAAPVSKSQILQQQPVSIPEWSLKPTERADNTFRQADPALTLKSPTDLLKYANQVSIPPSFGSPVNTEGVVSPSLPSYKAIPGYAVSSPSFQPVQIQYQPPKADYTQTKTVSPFTDQRIYNYFQRVLRPSQKQLPQPSLYPPQFDPKKYIPKIEDYPAQKIYPQAYLQASSEYYPEKYQFPQLKHIVSQMKPDTKNYTLFPPQTNKQRGPITIRQNYKFVPQVPKVLIPQTPLLPQTPKLPQYPGLPQAPQPIKIVQVPQVPQLVPQAPVVPFPIVPYIPQAPSVPSLPSLPSAPQVPLPTVPQLPFPSVPQVPSVPQANEMLIFNSPQISKALLMLDDYPIRKKKDYKPQQAVPVSQEWQKRVFWDYEQGVQANMQVIRQYSKQIR